MKAKTHCKYMKKLWNKIRALIRSANNNSGDYDKKHMKIKLNFDDDLPLKEILELYNIILVIRSVVIIISNLF